MPIFLLAACSVSAPTASLDAFAPGAAPADLVLVLVNGLRAGLGGADDAMFAAAGPPGVRYDAACAQSVHTTLSVGSILTGRFPSAVPLCSRPPDAGTEPWCARFPPEVPTLPEVLAIYGYRTALATTPGGRLDRALLDGEFADTLPPESLDEAVSAALGWWTAAAGAPRLLVFSTDLVAGLPSPAENGPGVPEALQEAYGVAAAAHGREVARLLGGVLDPEGPREAWALVGSAHGVSLGETTGTPSMPLHPVQHDILLDRTLHVPLRLYGTRATGGTVTVGDVVELVDVVPTFARLAGAMPPAGLAGRDLLAPGDPERAGYAEFGDMLSVRTARHLLVARLWLHGGTALDPRITERLLARPQPGSSFTLHDVATDPLQERNIVTTNPEVANALYAQLVERRTGPGAVAGGGLTEAQVELIRASRARGYW